MHKKKKDWKIISQNVNSCYFWGIGIKNIFCACAFLYFPTLYYYVIILQSGKNIIFIDKPINYQSYY